MFVIPFHNIDPVIFRVSSTISLNWYGLSYLAGVMFVMFASERMSRQYNLGFPENIYKNFMFWAMVAVVVGARLGDVIFYNHDYYLQLPLEVFSTWKGGMSFHGGLIGIIIASLLYVRYHKIGFLRFIDIAAINTPIALMFGRFANFINGELYGRVSEVAWAMPFPKGGGMPRHPSQLYEAFFEGIVLYVVLRVLYKYLYKSPGIIGGLFVIGYGVARFFVEYYREPEALSWIESNYFSGGQILCLLMILVGVVWTGWFMRRPKIEMHQ